MKKDELPEGWKWYKLSQITANPKQDIISGPFGSNLVVADYKNSGVPLIRLQNIHRGKFIDKDIKFVSPEKADELKKHSYRQGDIVIAKLGTPIGKSCIVPKSVENGVIVADVVRVRVDETRFNPQFIEFILNSSLVERQLNSNESIIGSTRPRVNLNDVRDLQIASPSLIEQQIIASTLDEQKKQIDIMIEQIDKSVNSIEKLENSYLEKLNRMYSRELTFLDKHIFQSRNGYGRRPSTVESGVVVLRIADVSSGKIDYSNVRRGNENAQICDTYQLKDNDLLFIRVNGSKDFIGKCILYKTENEETVLFNDHLIRVRFNESLIPEFIQIWCMTPLVRNHMIEKSSTSAGQLTINRSVLSTIQIPTISRGTQNKIISEYRKITDEVNIINNVINLQCHQIKIMLPSILNEEFGKYQIPQEV